MATSFRRTQPNPTLFDIKSPPLSLSHDGSAGASLSPVVTMATETMPNKFLILDGIIYFKGIPV